MNDLTIEDFGNSNTKLFALFSTAIALLYLYRFSNFLATFTGFTIGLSLDNVAMPIFSFCLLILFSGFISVPISLYIYFGFAKKNHRVAIVRLKKIKLATLKRSRLKVFIYYAERILLFIMMIFLSINLFRIEPVPFIWLAIISTLISTLLCVNFRTMQFLSKKMGKMEWAMARMENSRELYLAEVAYYQNSIRDYEHFKYSGKPQIEKAYEEAEKALAQVDKKNLDRIKESTLLEKHRLDIIKKHRTVMQNLTHYSMVFIFTALMLIPQSAFVIIPKSAGGLVLDNVLVVTDKGETNWTLLYSSGEASYLTTANPEAVIADINLNKRRYDVVRLTNRVIRKIQHTGE